PSRIYTPEGGGVFPIIVYLHGGGCVIGNPEAARGPCTLWANRVPGAAVSVECRRGPAGPATRAGTGRLTAPHGGEASAQLLGWRQRGRQLVCSRAAHGARRRLPPRDLPDAVLSGDRCCSRNSILSGEQRRPLPHRQLDKVVRSALPRRRRRCHRLADLTIACRGCNRRGARPRHYGRV